MDPTTNININFFPQLVPLPDGRIAMVQLPCALPFPILPATPALTLAGRHVAPLETTEDEKEAAEVLCALGGERAAKRQRTEPAEATKVRVKETEQQFIADSIALGAKPNWTIVEGLSKHLVSPQHAAAMASVQKSGERAAKRQRTEPTEATKAKGRVKGTEQQFIADCIALGAKPNWSRVEELSKQLMSPQHAAAMTSVQKKGKAYGMLRLLQALLQDERDQNRTLNKEMAQTVYDTYEPKWLGNAICVGFGNLFAHLEHFRKDKEIILQWEFPADSKGQKIKRKKTPKASQVSQLVATKEHTFIKKCLALGEKPDWSTVKAYSMALMPSSCPNGITDRERGARRKALGLLRLLQTLLKKEKDRGQIFTEKEADDVYKAHRYECLGGSMNIVGSRNLFAHLEAFRGQTERILAWKIPGNFQEI
jgi:hypothetical protein